MMQKVDPFLSLLMMAKRMNKITTQLAHLRSIIIIIIIAQHFLLLHFLIHTAKLVLGQQKTKKTREKKFGTNLTDVRDPGGLLLQRRRHQVNGHRRAHLRVDDNLKVKAAKVLAAGRRGAPSSSAAIFGGRRVGGGGGGGGIGGGNGGKGNGRAACSSSSSSTTSTGFAGVTGRRAQ